MKINELVGSGQISERSARGNERDRIRPALYICQNFAAGPELGLIWF